MYFTRMPYFTPNCKELTTTSQFWYYCELINNENPDVFFLSWYTSIPLVTISQFNFFSMNRPVCCFVVGNNVCLMCVCVCVRNSNNEPYTIECIRCFIYDHVCLSIYRDSYAKQKLKNQLFHSFIILNNYYYI